MRFSISFNYPAGILPKNANSLGMKNITKTLATKSPNENFANEGLRFLREKTNKDQMQLFFNEAEAAAEPLVSEPDLIIVPEHKRAKKT